MTINFWAVKKSPKSKTITICKNGFVFYVKPTWHEKPLFTILKFTAAKNGVADSFVNGNFEDSYKTTEAALKAIEND
jgi:hypothetical protein